MTVASPAAMTAYVISGGGSARLESVPVPEPQAGDVLIRVEFAALNRKDLFLRDGFTGPGMRPVRYPLVPGAEVVGTIVESPGNESLVDQRVLVDPAITCGRCANCRAGHGTSCPEYGNVGEQSWGGMAEYMVAKARAVRPIAAAVSGAAAAAAPVAFTTAWGALVTTARLQPGETVLITGIGGGVATAGLQISLLTGAHALVTSRQDAKIARALGLGAAAGTTFDPDALPSWVAEHTGGRGADVVLDGVGAAAWRAAIRSMATRGRMCTYGATSGDTPEVSIREIYQSNRQILGAPIGGAADFDRVWDLVERGVLESVVDSVYPLSQVASALNRLEANEQFGKIVLDCRG